MRMIVHCVAPRGQAHVQEGRGGRRSMATSGGQVSVAHGGHVDLARPELGVISSTDSTGAAFGGDPGDDPTLAYPLPSMGRASVEGPGRSRVAADPLRLTIMDLQVGPCAS